MSTPSRCPVCAARLRPDDMWCGQCHADLRPSPPPVVAVTAGPSAVGGPVRPGEVEALAREWAQRLAAAERGAGLPAVLGRSRTAGSRAMIAAGAGAGLLAVLLLVMGLAGLLL